MKECHDDQVPEELQPVVSRLRAERVEVTALELDHIKRRATQAIHSSTRDTCLYEVNA
jgi:hypothetical protein